MDFYKYLFYLIMCFAFSFLIGMERQYRKRIIGLRTTILVSIGAFLFVSFSFNVSNTDLSRIASQVVTGIGFLGAGVILKDGKKVRGLTTAATLWCDAAIGVLCAAGLIREAIVGTIVILFSNIILRYINKMINNLSDQNTSKVEYHINLDIKEKNLNDIKKDIRLFIDENNLELNNQSMKKTSDISLRYQFVINKKDEDKLDNLVSNLSNNYKLNFIELKKISELKPEDFDDEL